MKKKMVSMLLAAAMVVSLAACGAKEEAPAETFGTETEAPAEAPAEAEAESEFDSEYDISVITREDGSGTRGAFIELFGVEVKDEAGEKVDMTTEEATVTNNTSVMMTNVAGDEYAIGYISLGSLDETLVKALEIDGAAATVENIKNGTYKVARPFNIATKEGVSEAAQDFISYIMSAEGQAIVAEEGYITVDDEAPAFEGAEVEGKVVVAGSSSVTPVMEKLAEAYQAVNANVTIEIQASDSTTGMTSAIDGICDIGMASRELKDTELAELNATVIATDGIAVIVNLNNPLTGLTSEQVKNIYVGDTLTWAEVQ